MNLRVRTVVPALVVVLAASACGGDSEEDYSSAMASGLSSAKTQPLSDPKAECVADEFVERMGESRLSEAGDPTDLEIAARSMTFEEWDLSEPEGNELFDDFMDCGADLRGWVLDALGEEQLGLPQPLMDCLEEALGEGELRDFFVPLLRSGQPDLDPGTETRIGDKLLSCADTLETGLG